MTACKIYKTEILTTEKKKKSLFRIILKYAFRMTYLKHNICLQKMQDTKFGGRPPGILNDNKRIFNKVKEIKKTNLYQ